MDYKKLLTKQRVCSNDLLITPTYMISHYEEDAFMEDYSNIISSAMFRRLQDKTQVFPLERSDFVRTRLTHSLEVSAVASKLGQAVLQSKFISDDLKGVDQNDVVRVLASAGLLHDIGNPPFGHFGESVIGHWFKENLSTIKFRGKSIVQILDQQMLHDLYYFEGNAQTLRLLCKSKLGTQVNITKSIVATLIKYPVHSLQFNKNHTNHCYHKFGYFKAEQEIYHAIIQATGLKQGIRHPLTFLLEAADDIAYITADLEDAYKKGLFKIPELHLFLIKGLDGYVDRNKSNEYKYCYALFDELLLVDNLVLFKQWVLKIQMYLINSATYSFSTNYQYIINGQYEHDLFYDTYHKMTVKLLKAAMQQFVFNTRAILVLELSCKTILSFLLQHFVNAVIYYDEIECSSSDMKFMAIVSNSYKKDYLVLKEECNDEKYLLYLRLLMVVDFISSMTDTYAKDLYHELSGIT